MSAKKTKQAKKRVKDERINFIVTLITLSVIFVFVGYLMGQYAVKILKQQHQTSLELAKSELALPVVTSPQKSPISVPAEPATSTKRSTPAEPTSSTSLYRVQVGVFSEKENADRIVKLLEESGYEALIISGPPHRVQTGAFSSQENAARLMEELKQKGFEAIIVR